LESFVWKEIGSAIITPAASCLCLSL
jgi:hypothetical protein